MWLCIVRYILQKSFMRIEVIAPLNVSYLMIFGQHSAKPRIFVQKRLHYRHMRTNKHHLTHNTRTTYHPHAFSNTLQTSTIDSDIVIAPVGGVIDHLGLDV